MLERSDMISLSRYYLGAVDDRIPFSMQHPKIQQALMQFRNEIIEYDYLYALVEDLLPCDNVEKDAAKLFDRLLEQDMEAINANSMGIDYSTSGNLKLDWPFVSTCPEYLGKWYTWYTCVTAGGSLFETCFFDIGDTERALIASMHALSDKCRMDGVEFEDVTFFREGSAAMAVCAHEGFAFLNIEEGELSELKKFEMRISTF
jgi:hypothetical protein